MDPIKQARRVIVLVIGFTVVLAGLVLLVLPGPAFVVIPAGLAILSTEFVWAARLLKRIRDNAEYAASSVISAAGGISGESAWRKIRGWFSARPAESPHSNKI